MILEPIQKEIESFESSVILSVVPDSEEALHVDPGTSSRGGSPRFALPE